MSALKQWVNVHPKLAAWIVLAIGMVILVVWSAKDVGLLPGQMLALVVATIGLAGLCVWIIGWEELIEIIQSKRAHERNTRERVLYWRIGPRTT